MSDLKLAAEFEQKTEQDWLDQVEKVLRGADFEKKLVSKTYDDIRVDPLYARGTVTNNTVPGTAPFTRGWSETSDQTWDINQLHISSDPEAANTAILQDLEGGASSLTLRLAAPGQSGLPATIEALRTALTGVRLDMISLNLDAGHNFAQLSKIIPALLNARADEDGTSNITVIADPLSTLANLGALNVDMDQALQQLADLAGSKLAGLKIAKTVTISSRPYHNAGASEAEELSAMLATLVTYMRTLEHAGIEPAQSLPMMVVSLSTDADLFNSIAKLRAARRLIWQVADACGCPNSAKEVAQRAETSERMMSKRDPWVNMLRTTSACTGAALGGAQAITVLPFNWSLGAPDKFARRMSRNCQIVLMEEAALGAVIDPAGGSSYVDYLTDQLVEKSWALFQTIETAGGMFPALQSGLIQTMIRETHEARAKDIAFGKVEITGVSSFPNLHEKPLKLTPHEIAIPLDDESINVEPLPLRRDAEPFEKLRDAADTHAKTHGTLPALFLANLGELSDFNARANWAASFFSTGGIQTSDVIEYTSQDALIDAYLNSGTTIACICSSDAIYTNQAGDIARKLKAAGATYIYLAGRAGEKRDAYRQAGIDAFIHIGINILETLADAHDRAGITRPHIG